MKNGRLYMKDEILLFNWHRIADTRMFLESAPSTWLCQLGDRIPLWLGISSLPESLRFLKDL